MVPELFFLLSFNELLLWYNLVPERSRQTDAEGLKMNRLAEEEMVLQAMLTVLRWGPSPWAVVRHVRQYEGMAKARVEGDIAMVQFINLDWADKFREVRV